MHLAAAWCPPCLPHALPQALQTPQSQTCCDAICYKIRYTQIISQKRHQLPGISTNWIMLRRKYTKQTDRHPPRKTDNGLSLKPPVKQCAHLPACQASHPSSAVRCPHSSICPEHVLVDTWGTRLWQGTPTPCPRQLRDCTLCHLCLGICQAVCAHTGPSYHFRDALLDHQTHHYPMSCPACSP